MPNSYFICLICIWQELLSLQKLISNLLTTQCKPQWNTLHVKSIFPILLTHKHTKTKKNWRNVNKVDYHHFTHTHVEAKDIKYGEDHGNNNNLTYSYKTRTQSGLDKTRKLTYPPGFLLSVSLFLCTMTMTPLMTSPDTPLSRLLTVFRE